MTYCVGFKVKSGLLFCSDSRTNAGFDQLHSYKKMYTFGIPGERQFVLLASGNLATTHGVMNQLQDDIDNRATLNLFNTTSLHQTADYVGRISRSQQAKTGGGSLFAADFLLGGQIRGRPMDLLLIYPEGNYIMVSDNEPFLPIGESKYGKPMLDRVITFDTDLQTCTLAALVSMEATIRSDLSVGPPIDLQLYTADTLVLGPHYRLTEDSEYLRRVSRLWHEKLIEAFKQLPPIDAASLK